MKIVLIGSFPPSRLGLNEYTGTLAEEIKKIPGVELHVLADELPDRIKPQEKVAQGFTLHRCWRLDDFATIFKIQKKLRQIQPDVVWYNLLYSTFGTKKVLAFLSLLGPWMSRVSGYKTIITLHHLLEFVEVRHTKYKRFSWIDHLAIFIGTKIILQADALFLTLRKYVQFLKKKYAAKNVYYSSLGLMGDYRREPLSQQKNILVFGRCGSYKKVDFIVDVFQEIKKNVPEATLTVAGRSHPTYPGYMETAKEQYQNIPGIIFTGYVVEEKMQELFGRSAVVVLPYDSMTGSSGPAHLACAFGRPIVASRLPDLVSMAKEEGMAMETFEPGNHKEACEVLTKILMDPQLQQTMGQHNFDAMKHQSMEAVVASYMEFIKRELKVAS